MSKHFPPCRYSEPDCEGHNCGMGCAESDAEQRLHDAAPELLAIVETLVKLLPSDEYMAREGKAPTEFVQKMRAIIKRVKG